LGNFERVQEEEVFSVMEFSSIVKVINEPKNLEIEFDFKNIKRDVK